MKSAPASSLRIAIVGATSAIAHQIARDFARCEHASFFLVGRNEERLQTVAADLRALGATQCEMLAGDFHVPDLARDFPARAESALGGLVHLVLVAHGSLSDEARAAADLDYADREIDVNYSSAVRFVTAAASRLRGQKAGQLAVVTSVAGERGRASNAFYAATKGALIVFCSGLRARLARDNVQLTELRPGVIATPMTAHLRHGILTCSAERAGRLCARAIRRRADLAYIPGYWRWIMLVIRLVPETVFKKLKF
jgi:decaprenylphospho-beta-D-erythro-pentofuranosid-2-ulose 2-reductase